MASGKYERKAPTKTIKTYRSSATKSQGKYEQKSNPPRYKVPAGLTRRIFALVAATWIAKAAIAPAPPQGVVNASEGIPSTHVASTLEFSQKPTVFTLGIGNYGAEITIDNPQTPGEDNYSIYDSFVIVYENEVVTSDVHGNFLKGQLNNGDFTTLAHLTEDEMKNFTFYQVCSETGANLISDGNIIATVPNGDYVLALKSDTSEQSLKTLSVIDGNLYQGYMSSDSIIEIGNVEAISYKADQNINNIGNIKMVNTQSAEYINLNLREQPGQAIITEIPHGSFVQVLGETMQYGNKTWSLIKYEAPDGTEFEGWVDSGNYLSSEIVQEKPSPKVREGLNVNATGNITGIDISGMSRNDLGKLRDIGISAQTNSVHGTFDTSQLAGEVNFVGIKLGASAYSPGKLDILEYSNYMQQVLFCEENQIPYTLYYYSTSVTEEEALEELQVMEERINDLKQRYGLKYCIAIAVDKELAENTQPDRQRNGNIAEQTRALATLINGIQGKGLSNNVLIYAPSRVMRPDLDQIFDLNSLRPMLDNPENVALWHCSLMNQNGNLAQNLESDISYGKACGFETAMTQVVLDAKVDSGEKYDINNISFDWFKQVTQSLSITDKITYTLEFNTPSSQDEGTRYSLGINNQYDDELDI